MKAFVSLIPFLLLGIVLCRDPLSHSAFTPRHLRELKSRTKSLFQHGWNSYMAHGFPKDEVRPISCKSYGPSPGDVHNDALGNVSSTVLDNLDTLLIMEEWDELEHILLYLKANKEGFFDQDHVVQVFEASIRWLGGLLSAHIGLTDIKWKADKISEISANYDGFLLEMAYDLGLRLIPAYKTSTSLPIPRVNLAFGLESKTSSSNREACAAGATTPFLEFTILSRLTGDGRFENLTRTTVDKLWAARSPLGFLPMSLDPVGNKWTDSMTGIGASIDSFYEYALKGSIIFNDDGLWDMFSKSYQALMTYSAVKSGINGYTYFANIDTNEGERSISWIDSLSAFWPGVQVLAGRLSDAVSSHLVFLKIWDSFDAIPERWFPVSFGSHVQDIQTQVWNAMPLEWYPLRPEFIESTYYLYRATKDPMYLQIGLRVLYLFENRFKTKCGFSGYQDIRTGQMQDRMETFVLGETLKYLYLLFDEANESYVHGLDMRNKNWIFSTEAHPLWLTKEMEKRNQHHFEPFLSTEETPLKKFSGKGLLGSMWRGTLRPSNDIDSIEVGASDEEPKWARFGPELQPASSYMSVCEVSPTQWKKPQVFLGSGYYEWNQVFAPDALMNQTLVRPGYMRQLRENNIIELDQSFLDTYGLSSQLTCTAQIAYGMTEFRIGPSKRPEFIEIYKVNKKTAAFPFAIGDLVMPELGGRVRVDHLPSPFQNQDNFFKAQDSLIDNTQTPDSRPGTFFVASINGFQLGENATMWTAASFLAPFANPEAIDIIDNHVYIMGNYVENLQLY